MMKKLTALFLSAMMIFGGVSVFPAAADDTAPGTPTGFAVQPALYVHAVSGSADGEAWQAWQSVHNESMDEANTGEKYFFLPTSADSSRVDVYNAYSAAVTLNGVTIAAGETRTVAYDTSTGYSVTANGRTYTLKYMKSNAEAAVYINNSDADGSGTDLMSYLNANKENKATATGAIVDPNGKIDNTAIKKIKGRGNTSWDKPKKGYNITYDKKVSVAGMEKNKKFSILPNYQDDSLSRNRFLFDLSDAVGMPYASDSRYVDFYVNGYYWGSYQMTEKVEAGSLVTDVTGEEYLNEDGTINGDFPFIAEVDASAGADDYYVTCNGNVKITIKAPEIDPGQPGYDEVKAYVQEKFNNLMTACRTAIRRNTSIADLIDLNSAAKLYLINELGKNWDSGVSSTFLTYKPDENGNYKFFGSPVWDYDNSLGNAVGVGYELSSMGVSDYQQYTGWWCQYKGKSSSETMSYNIINNLARNKEVAAAAASVWFEDFLPAINHFSGKTTNSAVANELYTCAQYESLLSDSAAMNYASGWLLNTGSWIAPHSTMKKADFDFYTGEYTVSNATTRYPQSFSGMFRYAADWMTSRAAWISSQYYDAYQGSKVRCDLNRNGVFDINDITELQSGLAEFIDFTALQLDTADADGDKRVNVNDVTCLQRMLAGLVSQNVTEPLTVPEETPDGDSKVIFVNTIGWSGDIYIYYYGNGSYPLTWPGEVMTEEGSGSYTAEVPDFAEYVIFSNGSAQTEKIPFDAKPHTYRAVNQQYANGRYEYTID